MIKKIIIYLIVVILAVITFLLYYFFFALGIKAVYSYYLYSKYPLKYEDQINKYAAEFDVDPALISAVIYEESRFEPHANSDKGAVGLMQLLPDTAEYISYKLKDKSFKSSKIADTDENIRYGTYYLKYLNDKYDNLDQVLAAYNAGEGNVDKWISEGDYQIKFEETANFVGRVEKSQLIYEKLYFKK